MPLEPASLAHYLAACAAARIAPADLASTWTSAAEMRAFIARLDALAIPDAARAIRIRMAGGPTGALARVWRAISTRP